MPLNKPNNSYNKYYILNDNWFNCYLEYHNMKDLYNYLLNKKIIENIINNDGNLSTGKIIKEVISYIKSDFKEQIKNKNNEYLSYLNNEDKFRINYDLIKINKTNSFKYFNNLILLSKDSINYIIKQFSLLNNIDNEISCILGDNKIIFTINDNEQSLIEIGYLNEKNLFTPESFLLFSQIEEMNNNINLILNEGYRKYCNSYLLFNNDYTSPIFNKDGNIIGEAFKYSPSIQDYSNYLIDLELLSMITLYFNYIQLRLNSNEIRESNYYLINKKLMKIYKDYYDYLNLEKELEQNNIVKQLVKNLNNNNNVINDKNFFNQKKGILIIKNLSTKKINNENQINTNNEEEEPKFEVLNNMNIMYYNEFELINENVYNLLFGNIKNRNYTNMNYFRKCYILKKYIFFQLPESINEKK